MSNDNNDPASESAAQFFLVLWAIALAWRFAIILGWAIFTDASFLPSIDGEAGKPISSYTPNDHIFRAWVLFWSMVIVPMISAVVGGIFGLAGMSVFGTLAILIWSYCIIIS